MPSLGAQTLRVPAEMMAGGATLAGLPLVGAGSGDDEQPDKTSAEMLATLAAMAVTGLFFTDFRLSIDRQQTIER